jgi:hypothetical protein
VFRIIVLKRIKVYGHNCNKSWKERKCYEVVTKPLSKGKLNENFALSIYFCFHAFQDEAEEVKEVRKVWAKNIDEQMVREHDHISDFGNQLKQVVSQIQTIGLVEREKNETDVDDIYAYNDDWTIEKFLDPQDHTGFIGREKELQQLDAFANDKRKFVFWAIVGSSGSGKTRLYNGWLRKKLRSEGLGSCDCGA